MAHLILLLESLERFQNTQQLINVSLNSKCLREAILIQNKWPGIL